MPRRLTTLDAVCFPVEEHPVFASVRGPFGERRLRVEGKKAIVNAETSRVIGVVSRDYRLVTNQQALDWAFECCHAVFPSTHAAEWQVSATDAPSTGSYCQIDLVHQSAALDFAHVRATSRPEAFGPFIRVTNSYNALRALAFDIGFHRKVCRNGLIAPDNVIRFTFAHQRRDLGKAIRFDVARERLNKLQSIFSQYVSAVQNCPVPRPYFERMLREVLLLHPIRSSRPHVQDLDEWRALLEHLGNLSDHYTRELGENGYAVLNAMTDFGSRPPANRHVRRDKHSFQRLAGVWLNEFSAECQRPGFSVAMYLERLASRTTASEVA